MTIKKAIKSIEENNRHRLVEIYLYNDILKKYEELNKTDSPRGELTETMRQIFIDMVTMIKKSKETQIQFNNR
ncbi:MAG: hypothetical protein ACYDAJ_10900 [Nitrosotalea sp.]